MTTHSVTNRLGMASEEENQIEALSTALEETITKVIELNGECAVIATNRRDDLEKALTGISNGRLALQGYAGGARDKGNNRTPRFLSINA